MNQGISLYIDAGKSGVDGNNQRTSSDNMPPGNETFEPPKHPGIASSSSSSSEVSRPVTGVAENPDQNTTDENENNIGKHKILKSSLP